MRALWLTLALIVSACALPMTFEPSTSPSRPPADIEASVPHRADHDRAREAGAAECAKYGRVARYSRRDGGRAVYECVDPASAAQDD
jgi:hypothetical protein